MSRAAAVIRAVMLKDLRALWPLAALTAGLILAQALYQGGSPLTVYLPLVSSLASGLFVLGLVQLDAPASLRHDWLSRPIPVRDLLAAKALLAAVIVVLPAALGAGLAAEMRGAPVGEALLAPLAGIRGYLALGFSLLVVGAVTANLIEAIGLLIGFFLLLLVVPKEIQRFSGLSEAGLVLGSGWVVFTALEIVACVGGLVALWLQYAGRWTVAARTALGVTLAALAFAFALMSWDVLFAVQRLATGSDPAGQRFSLARAPGCLEVKSLEPATLERPGQGPWSEEQLQGAGVSPLMLQTAVRPQGLPDGWRMLVTHLEGRVLDGRGASAALLPSALFTPAWAAAGDGAFEARNDWLLSREGFRALASQGAALRLRYRAMLVAPVRTAEIPADGVRRDLPGLGSCSATPKGEALVEAICSETGRRADLLTARPAGAGQDREVAAGPADFAPDLLQFTPGDRRKMLVRSSGPPGAARIALTAYEARAQVERFVTIPGLSAVCRPVGP